MPGRRGATKEKGEQQVGDELFGMGRQGAVFGAAQPRAQVLYLRMHQMARMPSRQPIFLPSF